MAFCCIKQSEDTRVQKYKKEKLQKVYDSIKLERPWDIRPGSAIYTTAKEKYMIKLINDGREISDDVIDHVVGRCYSIHDITESLVCWFGYILTSAELQQSQKQLESSSIRKLNRDLICYRGALFYPVDMMSNPFGDWQPQEKTCTNKVYDEMYALIKQKWPNQWYKNELHKFTLKYLIKLTEKGNFVSRKTMAHVVRGCESDLHRIDGTYNCCYGFVFKDDTLPCGISTLSNKYYYVNENLFWCNGTFHYMMNPKYYQNTGTEYIPVADLRFQKYQTSQKVTGVCVVKSKGDTKRLYKRIIHRDLVSPKSTENVNLTWTEYYLIRQMQDGKNIPNEVISHALEGCYTWCHLLTEKYACCMGYIVQSEAVINHDFSNCSSNHEINEDLRCNAGRVYHRDADILKVSKKRSAIEEYNSIGLGIDYGYVTSGRLKIDFNSLTGGEVPNARPPPRPAPPPPDHLDDPEYINVVALNRNQDAVYVEHNGNNIDADMEVFVQNEAAGFRVRQLQAPPPPEFDI